MSASVLAQLPAAIKEKFVAVYQAMESRKAEASSRTLTFAGARSGEGTTTLAQTFAVILAAQLGKAVALLYTVDNTKTPAGRLTGAGAKTLKDAVEGSCELKEVLKPSEVEGFNSALLVPPGAAEGFHRRLKALARKAEGRNLVYVVQRGDSLTGIAKRFNVPLDALVSWNRLRTDRPIHPGDRLVVFPK